MPIVIPKLVLWSIVLYLMIKDVDYKIFRNFNWLGLGVWPSRLNYSNVFLSTSDSLEYCLVVAYQAGAVHTALLFFPRLLSSLIDYWASIKINNYRYLRLWAFIVYIFLVYFLSLMIFYCPH